MKYRVGWGGRTGTAEVYTAAELDEVLDRIHVPAGELPYSVGIVIPDDSIFPAMLEIGIGHPDRSFAYHVSHDGDSAWAYQPELEPLEGVTVNYAGTPTEIWPERARVTPGAARNAAREFVTTGGQRPSSLAWDSDE
jgi:hypothetical protein